MKSPILSVGKIPSEVFEFGFDHAGSVRQAEKWIQENTHSALLVFCDGLALTEISGLLSHFAKLSPGAPYILVSAKLKPEALWQFLQAHAPLRVVAGTEKASLQSAIEALIERVQQLSQERQHHEMVQSQTENLRRLNRELEGRVEKRQKSLARSRTRLILANRQIEALHASFLAIHRARSLGELESGICNALKSHLQVTAVRIRFLGQSIVNELPDQAIHSPLTLGDHQIGDILLFRDSRVPLSPSDQDLIGQMSEAVALGVDRLAKLEQAEVLKHQWQATFDAISEPLCLTDANFRILRTNRSFSSVSGINYRGLLNKNCFEVIFDQEAAAEIAQLGTNFKARKSRWVKQTPQTFEITAQSVHFESFDGEVFLVLLRDISDRLNVERQILESSKMAELGLIGSSIAHELNNPLGGMLSFIQLIRMDLKGNEPYAEDVREMESAAQRCRDIVQNLLGFARHSDTTDRHPIDLREVLTQSLKISELQSRSQGIVVQVKTADAPMIIEAQANQLSQAFCNLLQNATEAILERRRKDPRSMGTVRVELQPKEHLYELLIHDDGVGIEAENLAKIFNPLFSTKASNANPGLGLTMAYKIISEHNGHLEISSQPGVGTTAKIAFERPDFHSTSQVFDSKI